MLDFWHRRWSKNMCAGLVWLATAIALPAQTFTKLVDLVVLNGKPQYMSLVQGLDGCFYGTGTSGAGSVFKVTPIGALTNVFIFGGDLGSLPEGITLGIDGNFYGVTHENGKLGQGTVFRLTPDGRIRTLHGFDDVNGAHPTGALVQATNGSFYGTSTSGGSEACHLGCGTVFDITPTGTFNTIYYFGLTDGQNPWGTLVQVAEGSFYGSTTSGGANTYYGTLFKITPGGTLTTLHSFNFSDGSNPQAGMVLANDGTLYGTTTNGGPSNYGTVFHLTPNGQFTTLYNFSGIDGAYPSDRLIQATDGTLYGTTYGGGTYTSAFPPYGNGTIYKITPDGTLTSLYSFANLTDGAYPYGGLVQGTDGHFYGTTWTGGNNGTGYGVVFSFDVGLGPFVKTLPASGRVGSTVKILGTNLTGASSVTLHGIAATFTVTSPTLITATVPTGATTGKVKVVTPNGTLVSNVVFRVH